jgi:ribonucleoside-diphosphate reductase alpha chain
MKKVILSENAETVATTRYFNEGENWETCTRRVAGAIANVETNNKSSWEEKFAEMIYYMDFIPGGRILRNAGKPKGSLLNCYHLHCGDSIEEIGTLIKDSLILWSQGGGCGVNMSPLRPKGDPILGKGGQSSGLVSFLKALDHVANTIESGGQRRAAGIASVDISHPEILDFIDAKIVHGEISHFNISVMINDEFLEAVERDGEWNLKFKQKIYKTIRARDLWNKIVKNMVEHAEPGLLNTTNLYKNNSYYFAPITGVNPCGEITLSPNTSCCLGSLVLPNFITGSVNTNWQKLEKTIKLSIRFLDNVLDVNDYSLRKIAEKSLDGRRIGLGIMGLADYFFVKKVRYGSPESIIEAEKLMTFIRNAAYKASIELAIEKGSFPKFDPVMYGKASFVRKLPVSIRSDIKNFGIRNVTLLTVPPTGTTSLIPECTSGIEPLFFKSYKRKDKVSDRTYVHPKYKELLLSGEVIPDWYVDVTDLSPRDHFEIQSVIQRYVDSSISKTANFSAGTTPDQLSEYLLEYIYDLKGCTVYVDQTRDGQVYNKLTEEEIFDMISSETVGYTLSEEDVECNCSKSKDEDTSEICEIPV